MTDQHEAARIAQLLAIAAPTQATDDELQQWASWWRPSYEAARRLTPEQKHYLKRGGWWPPLCASQIAAAAPDIVIRTRRPELWRNHPNL